MVTSTDPELLFGAVSEFPDPEAQLRFADLVGIDDVKARLVAEATVLLDPGIVDRWSQAHHGGVTTVAAGELARRTPLIVLAGDVGTGKTEVAETFGDAVSRQMKIGITLYPLSLSARGTGAVGEMTALISEAFMKIRRAASTGRDAGGRVGRGVILLIDEADALVQSRDLDHMHHEDRAGVNAIIRGVDGLRNDRLPVLTVLCTNRPAALDPAIVRRAVAVLKFARPTDSQRRQLLRALLNDSGISAEALEQLVALTGARAGRAYGCTYSDIRQRLVTDAVLAAVRENAPLTGPSLVGLAQRFEPTPPFGANVGER